MALWKRQKDKKKEKAKKVSLEMNTPRLQDIFCPDGLEESKDYLTTGPSRYARVYTLAVYPRQIHVGWLDRIYALGDVDISVHVDPVPNRAVIMDLTRKVSSAHAQHMLYSKQGNILYLPELEQTIRDLESIRADIQTNRDKLFYVAVTITIHARSIEELNVKSDTLEDILAATSTQIRTLLFRQLDGLKSSIPINNPVITDYWRNMTTGGLACMMPIAKSDLSHPSGVFIGYNYHSGAPMFYDSFIGPPYLTNQHMAVFGTTGAGKSVALKVTTVLRSVAQGIRVLIIDPDGEYTRLVEGLMGGKVVRISSNATAGINILDVEPDIDDNGNPIVININDKINEVRGLVSAILENKFARILSPLEISLLEEAIREVYSDKGITNSPDSLYEKTTEMLDDGSFNVGRTRKKMPILTNLWEKLVAKDGSEELCTLMKFLLRDGTQGMFDGQTTVDLNSDVISFDISGIKDEFTRFYAMYVILGWSWQKFAQGVKGVDKRIVLDEGWLFMKHPDTREFLQQLSKRGRKYRTSLVVASQQVEDFLAHPEGRVIISNCETLMLLRQNSSLVDEVAEHFKLSSGSKEYLRSFAPGEALMSVGGNLTAVRITPTPYEWPWVQTVRDWEGG